MSVPHALFDLAVNRAATALRGVPLAAQETALMAWHARTRFARRVPIAEVRRCLAVRPGDGWPCDGWHWAGGPGGGWHMGKAAFP